MAARSVFDSSGRVIPREIDYGQDDVSMLSASWRGRRILTATLDGFEPDGNGMSRAIFQVGQVKVVIPYEEMGFDLSGEGVDPIAMRVEMSRMLGAIIDYVVRGIDVAERVAVASRRDAMLRKQRMILGRQNEDGSYAIDVGAVCKARVLDIAPHSVRVEVFGFQTRVNIRDISNLWVNDIREAIQTGE